MSTITQLTTVPADLVGVQASPSPSAKPVEKDPSKATASPPSSNAENQTAENERLVIREGALAGVFIYTILDRASGRVMVQIPREEVMHIANRPDYSAGQVVDTKV